MSPAGPAEPAGPAAAASTVSAPPATSVAQPPLRLGTRRSALAMTQAQSVADAITAATGRAVQLVEITTHGDVSQAALTVIGGTGVFVGALREALLAGQVDLAVHSLKDLPTADPEHLVVAAIPAREDPRDVLVARDGLTLGELPSGSSIGTGAPRRQAQLLALGYGFAVRPIRGNVDTRLRYVAEGKLDAIVLARAGLARLGRLDVVTEVLDPLQMLPAPGQGALAVECRSGDEEVRAMLAGLDDESTRAAVTAERTLLRTLEAGCTAPVGAYGEVVEGEQEPELYLRGVVASIDGTDSVRLSTTGPFDDAAQLGHRLARALLDEGAGDLMGEPRQ